MYVARWIIHKIPTGGFQPINNMLLAADLRLKMLSLFSKLLFDSLTPDGKLCVDIL